MGRTVCWGEAIDRVRRRHSQRPCPPQKAWSQHDLLESILSSYVDVVSRKGGRWPSWGVESHTTEVHDDLKAANAHLSRLGWMAKLTRDEQGWVMTVFPGLNANSLVQTA